MKKLVTIAVTVAVVITLFGAYYHVRAQAGARPYGSIKSQASTAPPAVLTSHTLITSYIDQGTPDTSLGSGFTAMDGPVTINCSNVAGCTVEAVSAAEVGANSGASNQWAICNQLDGSFSGICTFQATLPTNGTYLTGTLNNSMSMAVGTHTVQSFAYTTGGGAILAQYSNTYHLYKP
jgi:hypothetical protein